MGGRKKESSIYIVVISQKQMIVMCAFEYVFQEASAVLLGRESKVVLLIQHESIRGHMGVRTVVRVTWKVWILEKTGYRCDDSLVNNKWVVPMSTCSVQIWLFSGVKYSRKWMLNNKILLLTQLQNKTSQKAPETLKLIARNCSKQKHCFFSLPA